MCLLWSTDWVLISQKATFFIVTAVKTSDLTPAGRNTVSYILFYAIFITVPDMKWGYSTYELGLWVTILMRQRLGWGKIKLEIQDNNYNITTSNGTNNLQWHLKTF
jgi:hypothetical protein